MPKSAASKVLSYFKTAPIDEAKTVLNLSRDEVHARTKDGQPGEPAKSRKPRKSRKQTAPAQATLPSN